MIVKRVPVLMLIPFYCVVVVNYVFAKTVPPSQIEPMPDLYSMASTYPAANNVVNYNASPNPQYSSSNFNSFNEQTAQPPPQMPGNYQDLDYQQKPIQQQQKSLEELVTGKSPTSKPYDYSSDLKNTLVSMKDNLGFMADTQRLLLNSFKVQQQQYNNIEEKLQINDTPFQRNAAYGAQPNYGPPATQQPQYQSISPPPLPPLPYGQPTHQVHKVHHKKQSVKKVLAKLFKKNKKGNNRGIALFRRRPESERLQRHAALTLTYIKNGVINALWTALVVACVKLAPILLFGFKLMFKSVLPLTGLALFGSNRGLFPQKKDDVDDDIRFDDDDDDEEEEDEDELEDIDADDRDVSEEKGETSRHYR